MRASNLKMPYVYSQLQWNTQIRCGSSIQTLRCKPCGGTALSTLWPWKLSEVTWITSQFTPYTHKSTNHHISNRKNFGFPLPHVEQSPNISRILRKEVKDPHDFRQDFPPWSWWREGHLDPSHYSHHLCNVNDRICCIQNTRNINISKIYHSFTSCCCHFPTTELWAIVRSPTWCLPPSKRQTGRPNQIPRPSLSTRVANWHLWKPRSQAPGGAERREASWRNIHVLGKTWTISQWPSNWIGPEELPSHKRCTIGYCIPSKSGIIWQDGKIANNQQQVPSMPRAH